ncbi:MAG: glycosyltransferase family 2 protein [Gammaproteobacteria bacterium]|jgi:cellulose synthase/poly-beta-1,6-N-acetylglucosamine synthase-like glycosyltransferase|nr:glycosyltransferase family 2 protein [Gammaproteobacteria bacterium]
MRGKHDLWIVVFWIAFLLPLYSYLVYPPLVMLLGALVRRLLVWRQTAHTHIPGAPFPAVAIVVSAHNEEMHIAELLSKLRSLDYPAPVSFYVASDGSTDRTAEILQAHVDSRVRAFIFTENRGKASVLNDLLAATTEPIIVFTDANTRLEPTALLHLVRHFNDPRVGAVCGELTLRVAAGGDNVDGLYWRLERRMKEGESALGALLGANGAIYAIRRECFVPISPDTVIDDFCIAMTVAVRGRLLVYEPEARATEDAPLQIRDEFQRRIRIGSGNYQAFFRHLEFLFGINAINTFCYLSHKVIRWFTPHLLLLALLVNSLLLEEHFYRILWFTQIGAYAFCLILYTVSWKLAVPRPLRVPVFIVAMNVAFCIGFVRCISGERFGPWKRTTRA